MSELLKFAKEIRLAAKQLEAETQPEETILIDDKEKAKVNKELQQYSTFLRKFLTVKGNDELFSKLSPLFENPRLKKPRNTILLMLEKDNKSAPKKSSADAIADLRRILLRYGSLTERYPAIKLLKEILNFGVVNGIPAFKRLLSVERKLYNTFGSQGTLEKEKKSEN